MFTFKEKLLISESFDNAMLTSETENTNQLSKNMDYFLSINKS